MYTYILNPRKGIKLTKTQNLSQIVSGKMMSVHTHIYIYIQYI